jgi:ubiquinone biosynthesis protein COQ4
LRRLLSDKDDTVQVFEIMRALNGGTSEKNYRRLLETTAGGRIAYEHVELAPMLMDQAWLDSFAAGTVGAAYRDFHPQREFFGGGPRRDQPPTSGAHRGTPSL